MMLRFYAGVAPNKFLAKIASDWKKPNGLFVIQPHEVVEFLRVLPKARIVWCALAAYLDDAGVLGRLNVAATLMSTGGKNTSPEQLSSAVSPSYRIPGTHPGIAGTPYC